MTNHEITNTIPDRSNKLSEETNRLDSLAVVDDNSHTADILLVEAQWLKQNKEPQDTPDMAQENKNIWLDEEMALMARNDRIKGKEAREA